MKEFKINLEDIPSIFQLLLAQETQQETVEQIIFELKTANKRIEKLSKISYEQSKLLESLYKQVKKYEDSRDRFGKAKG